MNSPILTIEDTAYALSVADNEVESPPHQFFQQVTFFLNNTQFFENLVMRQEHKPDKSRFLAEMELAMMKDGGTISILPLITLLDNPIVPCETLIEAIKTITSPPVDHIDLLTKQLVLLDTEVKEETQEEELKRLRELVQTSASLHRLSLGFIKSIPEKIPQVDRPKFNDMINDAVINSISEIENNKIILNNLKEISTMWQVLNESSNKAETVFEERDYSANIYDMDYSNSPMMHSMPPQAIIKTPGSRPNNLVSNNLPPAPMPILSLPASYNDPNDCECSDNICGRPFPVDPDCKCICHEPDSESASEDSESASEESDNISELDSEEDDGFTTVGGKQVIHHTKEELEIRFEEQCSVYIKNLEGFLELRREHAHDSEIQPFRNDMSDARTALDIIRRRLYPKRSIRYDDNYEICSKTDVVELFMERFSLDITVVNVPEIKSERGKPVQPLMLIARWLNECDDDFDDQHIIVRNSGYSRQWSCRRYQGCWTIYPFGWDFTEIMMPNSKGKMVNTKVTFVKPTVRKQDSDTAYLKGVFGIAIEDCKKCGGECTNLLHQTPFFIDNDQDNYKKRYTRITYKQLADLLVKDSFNTKNRDYEITGVTTVTQNVRGYKTLVTYVQMICLSYN
jgi:hypothetical protein